MKKILWSGKLSFPIKCLVNLNSILALLLGNTRDTNAMKSRVKKGYNGAFTNDVIRYDELGEEFQHKAATALIKNIDLRSKKVLDVGCGTGVLSFLAMERGAQKVIGGDISTYMLKQCEIKSTKRKYTKDQIEFKELDAEKLPFNDNEFDLVFSSMAFGLFPDQKKAIAEMVRVLKPGGWLAIGVHSTNHYWEANDAYFKAMTKKYILGYRLEFWALTEKEVANLMEEKMLNNIKTERYKWINHFNNGGEAFDFFAAITSSWWFANFPVDKISIEVKKVRKYFISKNIDHITDDIILASGRKKGSA
jgi:ubiquinone/menaquinone biosynthesis C-methylase UbiE